jgi:multiple sugar transport system permease protein
MTRQQIMNALRWGVLGLVILVLDFPVIATVVTSLKDEPEIVSNPSLMIENPTLANYTGVFAIADRFDIKHYLFNSLVAAGIGTLLAAALALPAAYAMIRLGTARRILLAIAVELRALPLIVFSIPLYLLYQALGLLDTRLGLALILCLVNLPLMLVLLAGAVRDQPIELDEAARLDGAGSLGVLWRVVLPVARPVVAASLILGFVTAWNEFLFGLMLTTRDAVPVTVGASFFFAASGGGVRWGIAAAVMILATLPPMLLGLFAYRHVGRSMSGAGAIKA